ncbi:MAG: hypothetical protein IJC35_00815, partial [Oscillospiraceae bacterium]|nr:hypothetical protein [Oscillospiraceae bacterium]
MQTKLCLNGYWDFLPVYENDTMENALARGEWIKNRYLVPSSWRSEREMYNIFRYPEKWDEAKTGALRRRVQVTHKAGERVFLRFDAVGQTCRILANGTDIGGTEDMFLPVEAEVTAFLREGENDLEITLLCGEMPTVTRPDGVVKCLTPCGTWYAGLTRGIWQDAWLITKPETYLSDPFVLTSFREKCISFSVEQNGAHPGTAVGEVLDEEGNVVLTLAEGEKARWENPGLWMPDDPRLYTMRIKLMRDGAVCDEIEQKFGFREVWTEKHLLYINGVRVNLRGDSWHYQGLATQRPEFARNWCRFVKEQGVNYIRPHGFNYPQCFFDAADEEGVLMMAESAIYGSFKAMQADDPRFLEACCRHLGQFVREYRNHPSIIFWSMQNEMRWVDGRNGYKEAIPGLMETMAKEDPSGRIISCDGDNRLLTEEMMQAVSMHYNIDGRITDWNKEKPLLFGEHGFMHCPAPQGNAAYGGEKVFRDLEDTVDAASAQEANFLRYARREDVTGVSPYDYCNYLVKYMPFEDVEVDPGDITAPGPHPCVVRAFSLNINNGQLPDYPMYLPQKGLETLRKASEPCAVLPEEYDTSFFAGETVERSFFVYNDTCHDETAVLSCIAERDNGGILFAKEETWFAPAGSKKAVRYAIKLPESRFPYGVTLHFTLRHGGKAVMEVGYSYRAEPKNVIPAEKAKVICLGEAGSVPFWAAENVTYVKNLEALSEVKADVLMIGEDTPYTQAELQPVLQKLTAEKAVGGILILRQSEFAPGQLVLSKRPFFSVHPTGEHPVLENVSAEELFFWGSGNPEEDNADWMVQSGFDLPEDSGWRILLECAQGDWGWGGMHWCAMLEGEANGIPVVLTQLRLSEYMDTCPAARKLYGNCLKYLAGKKTEEKEAPVLCDGKKLSSVGAEALREGKTVIVLNVTPQDSKGLSDLLGQPVTVREDPCYQLLSCKHPLMRNVSDAQLFGMGKVMYANAAAKNHVIADCSIEFGDAQWLLTSCDAPWRGLFVEGVESGAIKIPYITRWGRENHPARCYGFAAKAGK